MKLSIKNARRLETTIDDQIGRLTSKINRSSSTFTTLEESVTSTNANITSVIERVKRFSSIKFSIRNQIGVFNKDSGIDSVTATIAELQLLLNAYILAASISDPYSQSASYRSELKNATFTSGLDESCRENYYIETLKITRQIQVLKDKCQGVNSRGTIEFDSETESFLKTSGLID